MTKKRGNVSADLNGARRAKNDEFYTQLTDIAEECKHYEEQFRGKTILCNCDDPRVSNFFRYCFTSFYRLELKKIISVCYRNMSPDLLTQNQDEQTIYCIYDGKARADDVIEDGDYEAFVKKNEWQILNGDGDFRSVECIELLKQSDIVVTNPPFSLFREYVAQLMQYKKQFLIIGNVNAITYKEIFPLLKDNKIWLGESIHSGDRAFRVPDHYPLNAAGCGIDENGHRFIRVKGVRWFTNIPIQKSRRYEELTLHKQYTPKEYPTYDNYDAIEVSRVVDIPMDYDGAMGVPITFLDKYNPNQFEILGLDHHDPDKIGAQWHLLNGKAPYRRIIIRKRPKTTM